MKCAPLLCWMLSQFMGWVCSDGDLMAKARQSCSVIPSCSGYLRTAATLFSSRAFESHGGLKLPQQLVDSMGKDSGPQLLQGSDCFEKRLNFDSPHDRQSGHDHPVAVDKGSEVNTDLRNRIAGQWRCPALAWKALEAMPVRNLFRVTQPSKEQKPLKDADEACVKTGDVLLSAVEDGRLSEKKLVTIVLAFQRWRHSQLKNIIGQELRKVLEEAREDETVLASLSTELENTEQQLATARANSSRLHCQLATAMNSTKHENGYSADNTTVSKSDRQMTTMEGFEEADTEIQLRDNQIQQLKERISSMEDQIGRVDGQLGRLQSERSDLQAENSIVLRENRDLLEQLSSRDKEMIKQVEEMKKLKSLATRLVEQQNLKQHQIDSMAAEHCAVVNTLQKQLQQALEANCSKEVELATSRERCSHLKYEKGTLLLLLQEAEKRADLASTHAEELCAKLQCTTDERAESSAETASEIVKHLKKLTQHVRELESTISATDAQPSSSHADGSTFRNRIEYTSGSKLGCRKADRRATSEFDQVYYALPQDSISGLLDTYNPMSPTCTIDNGQAHWITWKWRWAASSARAELLARKLHGFNQKTLGESHLDHKQQKVQELIQKLSIGNLTTCMEDVLNTIVVEHKLVPLILSAWRAFTRTSLLERKAISRSALLDKMLEALPWWIRKVRDRRQLERSFFQWLGLTLSVHRQPNSQQNMKTKPRSKVVVEPVSYESSGTPFKPPSTKLRLVMGPSDENAVTVQRMPRRAPAANAHPKRSPKENRNQLPSGSQSRALQALQTTLQQEVGELQKILCQEIQPLQRNSQIRGRLVTAPTESSYAKQRRPDGKKVLKSVLGVCNNLALALTNVKSKLSPHVRANTLTVRSKLSPRVLADTVNSCIRSEQTKISKGTGSASLLNNLRRQIHEGQSPKSSPRGRLVSGRLTSAPVMDLQEPCSKKHYKMEKENTTIKDRCNTTYALAPVQEIGLYKRGPLCDTRSRGSSDLLLNGSFVNKVLVDGAKNTLFEEEKLIESALARLVSTKISKLRRNKAV